VFYGTNHIMPECCFASLRLLPKLQGDAVIMGTSECLNGSADAVVFDQVGSNEARQRGMMDFLKSSLHNRLVYHDL